MGLFSRAGTVRRATHRWAQADISPRSLLGPENGYPPSLCTGGLGLGKYEAAFRENEIDETVLPSLTRETLKELGVAAVGHRLKLLDAIAALRPNASSKAPSGDAATTVRALISNR